MRGYKIATARNLLIFNVSDHADNFPPAIIINYLLRKKKLKFVFPVRFVGLKLVFGSLLFVTSLWLQNKRKKLLH